MHNILVRTSKLPWVIQSFYGFICTDVSLAWLKGKRGCSNNDGLGRGFLAPELDLHSIYRKREQLKAN